MNCIVLVGSLGGEPKVLIKGQEKSVRASIATNEFYYNDAGERCQRTDWHRLVFTKNLAEVAEKFLQKGSTISVRGKCRTVQGDNNKTYTYIQVDEFFMVGAKKN
ncbi:MAG: hypothetical protein OHK0045_22570 [Raineya sp.]